MSEEQNSLIEIAVAQASGTYPSPKGSQISPPEDRLNDPHQHILRRWQHANKGNLKSIS